MPALSIPTKTATSSIPIIESRIPRPEELVVVSKPMLDVTTALGRLLMDCSAKWAIGGDLGEILSGVNVNPEEATILTTLQGCREISKKLAEFQLEPPGAVERTLGRNAEIDLKAFPVKIKSYNSRFDINGQRVNVHGDLQIKVGDWEWGDPIDYEPEHIYVVDVKVPVVPLELKTEIYTGLGWIDRVKKIREAQARRHHQFG